MGRSRMRLAALMLARRLIQHRRPNAPTATVANNNTESQINIVISPASIATILGTLDGPSRSKVASPHYEYCARELSKGFPGPKNIDTSRRMIELAKQKVRTRDAQNAEFSQSDAFDTNLEVGSYSAILAFNVLHLTENTAGVLARLRDLLEPGGILISQTPCLRERRWIFRSLVALARTSGMAPPILNLKFGELESLISASGFEIVHSEIWDEEEAIQRVVARKKAASVAHETRVPDEMQMAKSAHG